MNDRHESPIRLDLRGYVASSRVTSVADSSGIWDEKEAALTRKMVAAAVRAHEERHGHE